MAQQRLVEIVLQGKDQTKGAFASLESAFGNLDKKQLAIAAGAVAVAAGVAKAVEQVYRFTEEMAVLGDEFDKINQRTGVAVETLSEFDFMVKRGGGTTADMETAVRRLARAMGDASDNVKESVDAFALLGISTDMLVGPNGELLEIADVLPLIADGLKNLNSQASRMDVAQAILGRGGTRLLPALQQGRQGIEEMRIEMERYGGAMTGRFAEGSAEFIDAQTNLANATQRLKEVVAEPFLAPFTAAINKLAEAMSNARTINAGILGSLQAMGGPTGAWAGMFQYRAPGSPQTMGGEYQDYLGWGGAPYLLPGQAGWQAPPQRPGATVGRPTDWSAPVMSGAPDWLLERWDAPSQESFGSLDQSMFIFDDMETQLANINDGWTEITESVSGFDAAGQIAAASFQSAMSSAFAQAIMDADNAADVIANIFATTFAQLAGSLISAGIFSLVGLPVGGPFANVFGGNSVSAATKALPGGELGAGFGYYPATAKVYV